MNPFGQALNYKRSYTPGYKILNIIMTVVVFPRYGKKQDPTVK